MKLDSGESAHRVKCYAVTIRTISAIEEALTVLVIRVLLVVRTRVRHDKTMTTHDNTCYCRVARKK